MPGWRDETKNYASANRRVEILFCVSTTESLQILSDLLSRRTNELRFMSSSLCDTTYFDLPSTSLSPLGASPCLPLEYEITHLVVSPLSLINC